MELRCVFFDFDGVLADSVEVKTRAFHRLYQGHGPEVADKVVDHHRRNGGMSRFEKFKVYARDLLGRDLRPGELEDLCDRFAAIVVEEVAAAPEIPGAGAFLDALAGVECYVVSGTPQEEMRAICRRRGMDGRFAGVFGSPTPKGEHVAAILARRGFDPAECLFFGDATADLEAARQNAVPFVGIVASSEAPLVQKYPDTVWFSDFHALLRSGRVTLAARNIP